MIDTPHSDAKTMLITGADGFLGSAAVEKALREGHHVIAVVNRHGPNCMASPALRKLKTDYRNQLGIAVCDITNEREVSDLFARHPEIDTVLHTAVAADFNREPANVAGAHAVNVDAVRYLAQSAQAQAAAAGKVTSFHMVSSDMALWYEKDPASFPRHATQPRDIYAKQKCEAVAFLRDAGLSALDISVTYSPQIQDGKPNRLLVSQLLREAQIPDTQGAPRDVDAYLRERGLDQPEFINRRMDIVHRQNLLQDMFAACRDHPQPGLREYSVPPDYVMPLSELVQRVKHTIENKRGAAHAPFVAGEHAGMDAPRVVRALPPVPGSVRQPYDFMEVLSEQYDTIGAELRRQGVPQPFTSHVGGDKDAQPAK